MSSGKLARTGRRIALLATRVALGAVLALFLYAHLAPLDPIESRAQVPGTVVLDANDVLLDRDVASGILIPITLDQVAPIMVAATLSAEDQRFYQHPGVDPLALARAASNYRSQPSGASTITQQLARRLYLQDTSLPLPLRKAREALIAVQLEANYSKDELLTAYLNNVYYGRGAYGVEAAARVYFGVSARRLDLAQASFLAGLPQLPASYGAPNDLASARLRQRYVLDRLVARGEVTVDAASEAAAHELRFAPAEPEPLAPHFVQFVLDELRRERPDLAGQPGLIIETTLDAGLQRDAVQAVRLRLADLEDKGAGNAAVVVIEPSSGAILGMVGSADFAAERDGQINMALAPRQPGSALKPFLYAASFERGYTAATSVLDVPTTFETPSGPYTPINYDRYFHGPVPVRVALASSLNVPAVRTLDRIGIEAFLELAHRVGLRTLDATEAYGLSLTLGGGEVRLLDLTAAYGGIANGGKLASPYAIARVRDAGGRVLFERESPTPAQVLQPEHAFLLADILSDPAARLPAFGERSPLETAFGAAVKTGTTSGFRDNWTVGFTPDRVVGVWVGNADQRSMRNISGVDGAAPIWRDVIGAAMEDLPRRDFARPPGLVQAAVCAPTGLAPGPDCPSPGLEWFVAGTEPTVAESYFVREKSGEIAINPATEARAWSIDARLRLASAQDARDQSVHIVSPPRGAVLYLAPELAEQRLLLRASVPAGVERVEFPHRRCSGRRAPRR